MAKLWEELANDAQHEHQAQCDRFHVERNLLLHVQYFLSPVFTPKVAEAVG